MSPSIELIKVKTTENYSAARELFVAYQDFLGVDLCFQSFDLELQQLAQMYAAPHGALILAKHEKVFTGCVAVRRKTAETCEMKRLFVKQEFTGNGIGHALVEKVIEEAKALGYRIMILDTLSRLKPALHLYRNFGFTETNAYYSNPLEGVVYMQKELH
jgi:GNAT superfamily N-acetyltransferase